MRTASTSERPNKGAIVAALKSFAALREAAKKLPENATKDQKRKITDGLCAILPTLREHDPAIGKKVRRINRSLGWFISRDGYPAAKVERKARKPRKANDEQAAQPAAPVTDTNVTNV